MAGAIAAYYGREAVVEMLLTKGANVDLADGDGDTALMNAKSQGHTGIVAMLSAKK